MKSVVGVSDWKVSSNPDDTIITYALGSCLGIAIYDPVARVAGILHTMLPFSRKDPEKAKVKPAMFVDSGFSVLLRDFYDMGAQKNRIKLFVAGGASMKSTAKDDYFKIGARNFTTLRKLLWKNGFMIDYQDVGGSISRTMSIHVSNGLVIVNKKPVNEGALQSAANINSYR